jgi:hypothetical protein
VAANGQYRNRAALRFHDPPHQSAENRLGQAACFHQNAVQRPDGNVDDFFGQDAERYPLTIKR